MMRSAFGVMMAATLMAAVAAAGQAAPARRAPAVRAAADWTRMIATTPSGSYVMGNPRAKVKLVEYLSLSCSHCAAFAAEGMPALKRDYIARGTVSLEVRNAVRDGFDFAGVMLSRCTGPAGYFATSERILATQEAWLPKATAFYEAAGGKPPEGTEAEIAARMVQAAGFDQLMRARGMAPARIPACLSDPKQAAIVAAMTQDAFGTAKIPGTPSFLINGVLAPGASTWATLQPKLIAALR